jgi:AI-2 transport protein TqsA
MLSDRQTRAMLAVCTIILVAAALYFTRSIFAPLAFAIFMVALVWPLQRTLETKLPQAVALLLTLLLTVAVVVAVSSMVTWALSVERAWLVGHAARFQTIYLEWTRWLEEHEIFVVGPLSERFDAMWLVRLFQTLIGHINTLVGFAVLAFVFLMLALMETGDFRERLALASKQAKGPDFAEVGEEIAAKIRKYMIVRTQMSVLTGLAVWGWALFSGLELAPAWGIIAFVVNYIPFIGSFIATLLPSLFAVAQFGTLHDSLFVLLGMFAIQFGIGNYLEPLVAGAALSISPLAVVFAVFFFGFLWGIPGAFLGVPILIAILMLCAHYPSTRWIATLLSGTPKSREPDEEPK